MEPATARMHDPATPAASVDQADPAPAWQRCGVSTTLEVIGGRWKPVIVFYLFSGTRRFSELRRYFPGITQRMLTLQLRELESDGVLERTVYAQVPPRVEYGLTTFGRSLEPVLLSLREWGERHRDEVTRRRDGARSAASD